MALERLIEEYLTRLAACEVSVTNGEARWACGGVSWWRGGFQDVELLRTIADLHYHQCHSDAKCYPPVEDAE